MTSTSKSAPGVRDTTEFYNASDPLRWVDGSLVEEIRRVCGTSLLDLGCGIGGYSRTLMDAGYAVQALDINPAYVDKAKSIGVDARQYDGLTIPLPDGSVDTVFMIEVLEHVLRPEQVLAEVARVARKNVVITVPNNTQRLNEMVTWAHMLDADHKHFFTVDSLRDALAAHFPHVDVREIASADHLVAKDLLSKWPHRAYRLAVKFGLQKNQLHFRLLANASK